MPSRSRPLSGFTTRVLQLSERPSRPAGGRLDEPAACPTSPMRSRVDESRRQRFGVTANAKAIWLNDWKFIVDVW